MNSKSCTAAAAAAGAAALRHPRARYTAMLPVLALAASVCLAFGVTGAAAQVVPVVVPSVISSFCDAQSDYQTVRTPLSPPSLAPSVVLPVGLKRGGAAGTGPVGRGAGFAAQLHAVHGRSQEQLLHHLHQGHSLPAGPRCSEGCVRWGRRDVQR